MARARALITARMVFAAVLIVPACWLLYSGAALVFP